MLSHLGPPLDIFSSSRPRPSRHGWFINGRILIFWQGYSYYTHTQLAVAV